MITNFWQSTTTLTPSSSWWRRSWWPLISNPRTGPHSDSRTCAVLTPQPWPAHTTPPASRRSSGRSYRKPAPHRAPTTPRLIGRSLAARLTTNSHQTGMCLLRGTLDGLAQDCSISIAHALEILLSCTEPLLWFHADNIGLNDCMSTELK